GEDAGERPGKTGDAVGNHRQSVARETRRITVGVEQDSFARRSKPLEHAVEDRHAGDVDQRLVAAAHAPREAAGEHEAENRRQVDHGAPPDERAAVRSTALRSSSSTCRTSGTARKPSRRTVVPSESLVTVSLK